ncbi:LysM peptidoglycan-binding domain-containing protein [Actinoplanes sp. NPDC020271]|uniref:LysM peptidoglycan-binding domain-containing protein n=1 Tax=Actinoplanes sp. NPDC020271 TaxID=3363896 RepID=UPI00378877EF
MSEGNELDEVKRKAAAFARQPSVWAATPASPSEKKVNGWRVLAVGRVLVGVLALSVIPPTLLVLVFGDPRGLVPSRELLTAFLGSQHSQSTPELAVAVVAIGLWLLWAIMMILLVGSLVTVVMGWRFPRWRLPAPLHRLLFGLAGTAVVAFVTVPHVGATAGQSPAVGTTALDGGQPGASTLRQGGTVTVMVGDTRFEYEVKRGDTLSKISRRWLGDADRWPEICRLNRHQHQIGGAELTDCDLIYPGWKIRLPLDARPPAGAATKPPRVSASPREDDLPSARPAAPREPGIPRPSPAAPTADTSPSASSTADRASSSPTTGDAPSAGVNDEHGVQLSTSSWISWTLAATISAAAAMVWLQRRRRYTGEPETDTPTELPSSVAEVRRKVHLNPNLPNFDSEPPGLPDLVPLPAGGTGLVGDGATSAARAALVAVLASGNPRHPDAQAEIVIDMATLTRLFGPAAPKLDQWPRMNVTANLDGALAVIEARILHRSRVLDEHELADLDELRQVAPDEEALPPVMLVTEAPAAGNRMRAKATLALGEGLRVSAILLGEWAHGATADVASDGTTTVVSGQPTKPLPPRLPVLDPDATLDILAVLREAHTGEPPTVTTPATPLPLQDSQTKTEPADTASSTPTTPTSARARLRVLGPPRIEGITGEGRPLRAKALELAVFLAVHPDGVATRDIGEHLEPDARISQADQRVHTNASNLRHVLSRAGAAEPKNSYVIKTAGRYRLDPATVDVDVWTLRDLVRSATIATAPHRRELLTAACDLYTAPLAEGRDYEWLAPHREAVRRWGNDAHLMLADDLITDSPQAASDLLDKAINLDIYNEALYTKAMQARHALGDADGIRTLLRALTKALADLDAEPKEETIALANDLRNRTLGKS